MLIVNPAKPPAIATWLSEHAVLGESNEALTGDLLEEFQRCRSVAWYWRQVGGAILAGFIAEVRAEWSAAGYAILGTFAFASLWTAIVTSDFCQRTLAVAIYYWSFWLVSQPLSQTYLTVISFAFDLVKMAIGLSIYLMVTRSFDPKRFWRALVAGFATFLLINLGEIFLHRHILLLARLVDLFGWDAYLYDLPWLRIFIPLLLSIWTAQPHWTRRRPKLMPT